MVAAVGVITGIGGGVGRRLGGQYFSGHYADPRGDLVVCAKVDCCDVDVCNCRTLDVDDFGGLHPTNH